MASSRIHILPGLALAAALGAAGCATARSTPSAAAAAPLAARDGTTTTLDALRRERDATVLVFWSGTCPCVRRYQDRVDALLDAWPRERVRVVGISSNAGERFVDALRVADERGVRIPILHDDGGRLADALGVSTTPTVVVLDRAGEVRYRGWVDNERLPGAAGREPWLDRALAGVLDGKTSFSARSPVYGCAITRSLFGAPQGACCTAHQEVTP
jgi:peroxiredoxin